MIPTLTTNGFLYRVNRHRAAMELYIQKRKALGYVIAITILVTIATFCWIIHPVPSFDNKTPVVQTTQGDRP